MAEPIIVRLERGGCTLCDPPKRAGAVSISGSVGANADNRPPDVRIVQQLLNGVPVDKGGPIPPLAVDGLCYGKSLAAIYAFQKKGCGFKWPDRRIDPGGRTWNGLTQYSQPPSQPPEKATPSGDAQKKATPEANKKFIKRIIDLLPRAQHWVAMAQLNIDLASDFVRRGRADATGPFRFLHDVGHTELNLFNKYFHADKYPSATKLLQLHQVRRIYVDMQAVLTQSLMLAARYSWGVGYFQPDPDDGTAASLAYDAYTFFGGWQRRRPDGTPRRSGDDNYEGDGNLREDTIFFPVGQLHNIRDVLLTETIIHELAHFVGPGGPTNGNRIADYTDDTKSDFLKVNNWTALHSADIYGYFAAESGLRLPLGPA